MNYTVEQGQAVHLTNQNILVSAGAGAGKTRVLVDRIADMLLREENSVSADQLLVLTFTNAAAAEMKERIEKELNELLEKDPSNLKLRRQRRLMKTADVSTVHSFCGRLIRGHFEQLGLDPSFRIGEEGELVLLQKDVMEQTLEEAFLEGSEAFHRFVEAFAPGKEDSALEGLVEKVYKFSRGFPDSRQWFDHILEESKMMGDPEGLARSSAMQFLLKQAKEQLVEIREILDFTLDTCKDPDIDTFYSVVKSFEENYRSLEHQTTYKGMYDAIHMLDCSALPKKGVTNKVKANVKYVVLKENYDVIKKMIQSLLDDVFAKDESLLCKENQRIYEYITVLIHLTSRYEELYAKIKHDKNVYDFDDLEHFALKLLVDHYDEDGRPVPTDTALELRDKYKEIFVDEYQDTNLVQETLLQVLWQRDKNHLFMVGDVKQSIYRFRMARPDLFLDRYHAFGDLSKVEEDMGLLEAHQDYRIELRDNFRSTPDVLNMCNFFFYQLMTEEFGGINYDEHVALRAGENGPMHDVHEPSEVMLYLTDEEKEEEDDASNLQLEAAMIAKRMKELRDEGYSYGEMVILLRSNKNCAEPLMEYLRMQDVPAICESHTGYFQTREISLMMNYLAIVDNVYQDIPMASVLLSSFGKLTEEELAILKAQIDIPHRPHSFLYDLMEIYIAEGSDEKLVEKLRIFMTQLEEFRKEKQELPIGQLIWNIYLKTGFYYDVQLMPEGEKRRENLLMLLSRAEDYEQTVYKGLFYFLRYMEELRSYEVELSLARDKENNADVVRIMTIHKSKGLEFPVVFVSCLSKKFNLMDLTDTMLLHPDLGIGLDDIDLETREKRTSFMKHAMKGIMRKDLLEEELRTLYVAMTRAKNRLILTGVMTEKTLEKSKSLFEKAENPVLASNALEWVLGTLVRHKDYQKILAGRGITDLPEASDLGDCFSVRLVHYDQIADLMEEEETEELKLDYHDFLEELPSVSSLAPIQKSFEHVYAHKEDTIYKRKYSVSEIKMRQIEQIEEVDLPPVVSLVAPIEEVAEYSDDEIFDDRSSDSKNGLAELSIQNLTENSIANSMDHTNQEKITTGTSENKDVKKPRFLKEVAEVERIAPTTRGTIVHKVMELLPMGKIGTEISLLDAMKHIEKQYPPCKDISMKKMYRDAEAFLQSEIGAAYAKMDAEGKFHREVPFTVGVPVSMVEEGADSKELVIIQGIIDAYGEAEDGIWLLDYKTDRVKADGGEKQLLDHYTTQMLYYKTALEQVLHKKVSRVYIYSFQLHRFIEVECGSND